ncbi:unnamed protein product [Prunus armeniaca]
MVAPPPLATVPPTGPAAGSSNLRGTAAEHGGTSYQGGLVTTTDLGSVLEQLQAFPPLPPRSMHALGYTSNENLARVQLGSTRFSPPDPQSQADLNLRVDQLAQRMDDQNALMRQLLNQTSVAQNLGLGQPGEERRIDERTSGQLNGHQAGRAGVSKQGDAQPRDQLADMSRASASHTQSNRNVHERLGPQGGQPSNPCNEDREKRHSTARSRRTNSRHQAVENPSQTQSTNTPSRQREREDRPSRTNEEVNQRRPNRKSRQRDRLAMCAEDVEKLMNDRLRDLKTGGNLEDTLRKEMDQVISTPFTPEIEQAAPPKRFSTPSFTHFKGDFDPESHLKHFKSVMILHKADDALMCKAFAMTLRGAAQDWFHTLPSGSINSFKELAYVFTKEYTAYRTIKKNPDHLLNLRKKPDESIRDYIKRFKVENANIVGCDDQIASSAFKKGLLIEHELYRELTITPSQTLAEVFATPKRYALWDDDRIATKKSTEQGDRPTKRAGQRSDEFSNKNKDKCRSHPQGDVKEGENYTKFTIPIHQILAQVKNKPWVRRPPPLKGDPDMRDTSKYCHCIEFIAKQAIQQIEDHDTAKEPPQKVIRINTILADSEESGLTSKGKKRQIKQATMISQVSTDLPLAEDDPVIGFQKKDLIGLGLPHNDALVINIQIAQAMVDRIHADEGSAANILQLTVIQQMGLKAKINKSAKSLTGFNGATTVTVGTIELDVYTPPPDHGLARSTPSPPPRISKKLELEPDMAKVRRALNIPQKFCEWRWLLSEYQDEDGGLPPAEDVERWKQNGPDPDDLSAEQEACSAEPPSKRKAEVKSPRTQATSSRARNVSPLRKKPKLPSAEKTQVGVVPASSARVKHLVGADSKKIGGMRNIRDAPLKPIADEFGDPDLLREVVRARSSSPVERQRDADVPPRSSGRLHQSKSGGRCGRSAHSSNRHDPTVESRAIKRGVDSTSQIPLEVRLEEARKGMQACLIC